MRDPLRAPAGERSVETFGIVADGPDIVHGGAIWPRGRVNATLQNAYRLALTALYRSHLVSERTGANICPSLSSIS